MTTYTQTTTRARIATGAAAAATLLRERYKTLAAGSDDATAASDAAALVATLTAAAADAGHVDWSHDTNAYTLTWTTSGANDPATKRALWAWLHGSHRTAGANHLPDAPVFGGLGTDLASLINQL